MSDLQDQNIPALDNMAMHGITLSAAEAIQLPWLYAQSAIAGGHPFLSLATNLPSR
jgi:hypothetical protein